ncbi:hypothetical protein CK203_093678 [Vitis vinifera]|uniref:Uncharacterized protein n=1 Tax=Vitis vinifera TaxID=29760 RepID=A0A438CIC8_VITVI|nr:hypothetical protein CK203_093678 [Vitis vinifera]
MDFYQSMTTHQVRDPTVIHFTIEGRHALGTEERSLLEALFRISEGFFFGPHHLIMAALLYFEEKVHKKKLLRADAIPLLFPRLLCQILEHLGAKLRAPTGAKHPDIPRPEQSEEPQPVEIPVDMRAPAPTVPSIEPIPEVAPFAPSATPWTPLGLCHTLQALATSQSILAQEMTPLRVHQEQIIATQT